MTTALTPAEEAEFTAFNALAFDWLRVQGKKNSTVQPCWLCCSTAVRDEARTEVLWLIRTMANRLTLLMPEAEKLVTEKVPLTTIEGWKRAELERKAGREAGDPRAYFAQ